MEKLVPIYKEILGDLDTPVSIYLKLNQENSFLLESVTGGEQVARYSFIGLDPFCIFKNDGKLNTILLDGDVTYSEENPIDALQALMSQFQLETIADLPSLFGGAVGYFSWETIHCIEKIQQLDKPKKNHPLVHFLFPRSLVVFDHVKRKIILATFSKAGEEAAAKQRLADMEAKISQPLPPQNLSLDVTVGKTVFEKVKSNYQKETFIRHVEKVQEHIYEGDVFQLVLSQEFTCLTAKQPFDIYRKLRLINPSPYMFYFNFNDYQIIGSSPEILVRLINNTAQVRPIAGTRPRGDGSKDAELIADLKADEKEKAEHIMLVDLGRNDLGRVCEYSSIKTTELMEIEKYSHVMHMVTNVTGQLQPGKNAFDLFKATFPAGTVSGAPKIRAMEIIEELEPTARGIYAGALGYFDFRGNMDLCITIRTIFHKDRLCSVQAGAGLVADSDPQTEYAESQNKAQAMLEACL